MDSPDVDSSSINLRDDDPALQGCCSPKKRPYRFFGLALMCFLGFGSYFCYDNPGALQDNFKNDLNITTGEFSLLYSVYSWPNVVLCFIGGFLIDSVFGIRLGTIIYMTIAMIGQTIFALGGYENMFWMMLLGRFIFGIGAESLAVAQNSYAVLWFKGKELNMVFGLQLSFARIGSTVNFLVMEHVYTFVSKNLGFNNGPKCIGVVLFLASLTCVGSLLCALILGAMDRRREKILRLHENKESEVVRLRDVKDFKKTFWMVAFICVSYYIAIFPFIALGKVYFEKKYNYSPVDANQVNAIVYIISAVSSPFFGLVVDKTGLNMSWVLISICGSICAHGLLAFTFLNPYACMIILGLSYSLLASSLWPLIALIVPEHQLGTAYGIAQAEQNLGLAITSYFCGIIVDYYGYFMLEIFFLSWLWVSLVIALVIWISDRNATGGYLNMTPYQRLVFEGNVPPEVMERERLLDEPISDLSSEDITQLVHSESTTKNKFLVKIDPDEAGESFQNSGQMANTTYGSLH